MIGYWHNFDNGSTNIRLRDISAEWDVVQVAVGEITTDRAVVEFAPYNCIEEEFKEDIKYLNSRGVRVLLSLGGQNGVLNIDSTAGGYIAPAEMKKAMVVSTNFKILKVTNKYEGL